MAYARLLLLLGHIVNADAENRRSRGQQNPQQSIPLAAKVPLVLLLPSCLPLSSARTEPADKPVHKLHQNGSDDGQKRLKHIAFPLSCFRKFCRFFGGLVYMGGGNPLQKKKPLNRLMRQISQFSGVL